MEPYARIHDYFMAVSDRHRPGGGSPIRLIEVKPDNPQDACFRNHHIVRNLFLRSIINTTKHEAEDAEIRPPFTAIVTRDEALSVVLSVDYQPPKQDQLSGDPGKDTVASLQATVEQIEDAMEQAYAYRFRPHWMRLS